jgi:hypothetical protein
MQSEEKQMMRGWKYRNKLTSEVYQVLFNLAIDGRIDHRLENIKSGEITTLTDEQMIDYERVMPTKQGK